MCRVAGGASPPLGKTINHVVIRRRSVGGSAPPEPWLALLGEGHHPLEVILGLAHPGLGRSLPAKRLVQVEAERVSHQLLGGGHRRGGQVGQAAMNHGSASTSEQETRTGQVTSGGSI
jgi:hypothetical protein